MEAVERVTRLARTIIQRSSRLTQGTSLGVGGDREGFFEYFAVNWSVSFHRYSKLTSSFVTDVVWS
jgi:hypothetical protein